MTTAAIVFLLCWATLTGAARTPAARLLHRLMVQGPATALNRVEPGHVALAIVVTVLVVVHLNAGDGDPVRLFAMFAPDVTLWLASIEFGAVVEALFAAAAATAAFRRAGIAATLQRMLAVRLRHPKNRADRARHTPRRDRTLPANDDEDGAAFALARRADRSAAMA